MYHTIFRFLQLLNKFDVETQIEVDRLRIWDFYLLFPNKIHTIRLKQDESDIRQLLKRFVKENKNPYEIITEDRKVFEKIKLYQLAALNCIASYGLIDKSGLNQQRILITNKDLLNEFVNNFGELPATEKNIISFVTGHFCQMSMFGKDGLKQRTNLIESKYDE
jgi:hypothetical protein